MADKRTARLMRHILPMHCNRCGAMVNWRLVKMGWSCCPGATFGRGKAPRPWKVAR